MKTNDNRTGVAQDLGRGSAGWRGDSIAAGSRGQHSRGTALLDRITIFPEDYCMKKGRSTRADRGMGTEE